MDRGVSLQRARHPDSGRGDGFRRGALPVPLVHLHGPGAGVCAAGDSGGLHRALHHPGGVLRMPVQPDHSDDLQVQAEVHGAHRQRGGRVRRLLDAPSHRQRPVAGHPGHRGRRRPGGGEEPGERQEHHGLHRRRHGLHQQHGEPHPVHVRRALLQELPARHGHPEAVPPHLQHVPGRGHQGVVLRVQETEQPDRQLPVRVGAEGPDGHLDKNV